MRSGSASKPRCAGTRARARRHVGEGLAVTGNHDADIERGDHIERRPRCRHRGRVELGRHDEAEAVLPQRVAGDQDPVLGVVEHERAHVVARRCERAPFEIAPDVRPPGTQHLVDGEPLGALVRVVEQQRRSSHASISGASPAGTAIGQPYSRTSPRCRRCGRSGNACSRCSPADRRRDRARRRGARASAARACRSPSR